MVVSETTAQIFFLTFSLSHVNRIIIERNKMKVKDLLEIQGIIDNRIIPSDMNDNKLNEHYSKSKGEFMSILDMDLIHLVRSYSKCIGQKQKQDNEIYLDMDNKKEVRKKIDDIINISYELGGIIKND
jgi:hypothetical protein